MRTPFLAGADGKHWLFFAADAVHQPPRGNNDYHVVAYQERWVCLDWNFVFATELFSTPPSEYEDVLGMVLELP